MKKIVLAIAILGLFQACKPTEPDEPKGGEDGVNLTLKFTPMFNGDKMSFLSYYIDQSKDTITVDKLKFIMSNFTLEKENGEFVTLKDAYGYLSLRAGRDSIILPHVPKGKYKSFRFYVGLDSAINHGDPSKWPLDHPLAPSLNDMNWSWAGGYIFNVFEGTYKNASPVSTFSYHIATLNNARTHAFVADYELTKDGKMYFNINVDKYFDNVVKFSIKDDGNVSHSADNDPIMEKFIKNMPGIFSYDKFQ